ncbi:MAG: hypothetical protein HYV63_16285 [Candidatus Schekmanbacteria bacterium]|nr:hypothetical protein [Candidatus Schekmanbacteria bacterium]
MRYRYEEDSQGAIRIFDECGKRLAYFVGRHASDVVARVAHARRGAAHSGDEDTAISDALRSTLSCPPVGGGDQQDDEYSFSSPYEYS